ncbi:MAG: hypothetical protein ACLT98_10865 [Eggerthellaceae bacterium]
MSTGCGRTPELVEETGWRCRRGSRRRRTGEACGAGGATAEVEALAPARPLPSMSGCSRRRNLLALRLRYRPDDALVNVLRSLGE